MPQFFMHNKFILDKVAGVYWYLLFRDLKVRLLYELLFYYNTKIKL